MFRQHVYDLVGEEAFYLDHMDRMDDEILAAVVDDDGGDDDAFGFHLKLELYHETTIYPCRFGLSLAS